MPPSAASGYSSSIAAESANLVGLPNVTALRNHPGNAGRVVHLRGYQNPQQSDQGLFQWDVNAAIDDGVTRFNQGGLGSNEPGWSRNYDGYISALWAGVVGDGVTDDTAAILRAIAAATATTAKSKVLVFPANAVMKHTGFTIPSNMTFQGTAGHGVNTIAGGATFLAAGAGAKVIIAALGTAILDCIFSGNGLATVVVEFHATTFDVELNRVTITRAVPNTGDLVSFPGTLEIDNVRFRNCVLYQNVANAAEYCRYVINNTNTNAFNIHIEHSILSNGSILAHYSAGSCNIRHCQAFRAQLALVYVESAAQPFVLEDIYNEGDSAPFLWIAFNAGVKSSKPIVIRDCYLNGTTPVITACTQELVIENTSIGGNISVEPVPEWGAYGVVSRNVSFVFAGTGFIGNGRLSRVDEDNDFLDPFGANVRRSRYRLPAWPYNSTIDLPNSAVFQSDGGPTVTITGQPAAAYRGVIKITTPGARGVALFEWSTDNGATWTTGVTTAASVVLGATGLTANFAVGTYVLNEYYSWTSGIGGEFGNTYVLGALTANRIYPLFAATLEGQFIRVSLVGSSHGFTTAIKYLGVTLATLQNVAGATAWADFVYDNNVGWVVDAFGGPVSSSYIEPGSAIGQTLVWDGAQWQSGALTLTDPDGANFGAADDVLTTNTGATANQYRKLVNANVDAAAAIAVSKLAAGSARSVLTSNGSTDAFSANPQVDTITVGSGTVPSSGNIRLPNVSTIVAETAAAAECVIMLFYSDDNVYWGDGTNNQNHIFRAAVGGEVQSNGTARMKWNTTGLGFFNTAPVAKPNITGSRVANPALANLLTGLANLGLITDSTTV